MSRPPVDRALRAGIVVGILLGAAEGCRETLPSADSAASATAAAEDRRDAPAGSERWVRVDSLRALLRLDDGRTLSLVDDTSEGNHHVRRSFVGTLAGTEFLLVEQSFYEGSDYLLVHARSGRISVIPAIPVPSPDRSRLLVASADLEAGYAPNVVQIWRIDGDSLVSEWELATVGDSAGIGWGARSPKWLGDSVAVVTSQQLRQGVPASDSALAWIVRRPSGWSLEEQDPGLSSRGSVR